MKTNALIFLVIAFCQFTQAQTTGSFQQSITFNESDYNFTRTLYYYVPTDYDANQSYKLVVGFRGGPHSNAGQFRDQLTFLADSINAIVLCPENADHFWNQEGLTKQLFSYSVASAMDEYNIDEDYIYLTGLSYGGRHAVIVSMDTDDGPIPNLRGVIPFAAGSDSHLMPDYEDVDNFPPACICIGLNDNANFINVSNTLHDDILSNGGSAMLNEIPNVGHTVAFSTYPQEMMECINFIEAQYTPTIVDKNVDKTNLIILFPNPSSDFIKINSSLAIEGEMVSINTIEGKKVTELFVSNRQIDISGLGRGIYFLVIDIDGKLFEEKFVVNK